ncbi:TetR/AcrR family transcriptional regulator [Microcella sp.]|uniref:TetR/AcrR family transcriptional regulator n=1 Tax=Microcella sp. TaxID=1913979 RepID=UPI003F6E7D8C
MDARIARTRESVLAAARTVLLDEGLLAVTPTRVAEVSGVARRTIYRHWPGSHELLHDALASASFPTSARTGDLAADLRTHLEQLRAALHPGPLAFILLAMGERAAVDPDMRALRSRLVEQGCAPLRAMLLDHGLDPAAVDDAVIELEGPVMTSALVHGRPASDALLARIVEAGVERVGERHRPPTEHN